MLYEFNQVLALFEKVFINAYLE